MPTKMGENNINYRFMCTQYTDEIKEIAATDPFSISTDKELVILPNYLKPLNDNEYETNAVIQYLIDRTTVLGINPFIIESINPNDAKPGDNVEIKIVKYGERSYIEWNDENTNIELFIENDLMQITNIEEGSFFEDSVGYIVETKLVDEHEIGIVDITMAGVMENDFTGSTLKNSFEYKITSTDESNDEEEEDDNGGEDDVVDDFYNQGGAGYTVSGGSYYSRSRKSKVSNEPSIAPTTEYIGSNESNPKFGIIFKDVREASPVIFTDVQETSSTYSATKKFAHLNILDGFREGLYNNNNVNTYREDSPLNRTQALKIILQAKNITNWKNVPKNIMTSKYIDPVYKTEYPHEYWVARISEYAEKFDLMTARSEKYFEPNEPVTISEMKKIMDKLGEKDLMETFIIERNFDGEDQITRGESLELIEKILEKNNISFEPAYEDQLKTTTEKREDQIKIVQKTNVDNVINDILSKNPLATKLSESSINRILLLKGFSIKEVKMHKEAVEKGVKELKEKNTTKPEPAEKGTLLDDVKHIITNLSANLE